MCSTSLKKCSSKHDNRGRGFGRVAIVQPCIPHYRDAFFSALNCRRACDIYTLLSEDNMIRSRMSAAQFPGRKIGYCWFWRFAFYNFLPLFRRRYRIIVLMSTPWQVTNWLVLLLAPLLGKKTVLWGHGIEVGKYMRQQNHMPFAWKMLYRLTDGAWFYTENERKLWACLLPELPAVGLGNTIESFEDDKQRPDIGERCELGKKYRIKTPFNFIFCARFNSPKRRIDILEKLIEALPADRFGFILIGSGDCKPDFSGKSNVYDFGPIYDDAIKTELFTLADVYFQPAWLGLSVVEAMVQGKPILTFDRSDDFLQGVEFGYIAAAGCGIAVSCFEELLQVIRDTTPEQWDAMGICGRKFAAEELTIDKMADRAELLLSMVDGGALDVP
jgi:glycosyltransferase involved in cell wall biosynthesis